MILNVDSFSVAQTLLGNFTRRFDAKDLDICAVEHLHDLFVMCQILPLPTMTAYSWKSEVHNLS